MNPLPTAWIALLLLAPLSCMATRAPPITVPFDHLKTGFELDGPHRDLPCESCHVNAVFKGTPRDCATCHTTGSQFNATPKTANHIATSNACAACHNTISFRPDVHFDHAEVMGNCVSCHNGTVAQGESASHIASSQNCAACHTVVTWNPPKLVDHTQIPLAVAGFCIICHNGTQAEGKPGGHVVTSLECGDCHLTTSWLGASFDHSGIIAGCSSCHDGTKAVGKGAAHMPTSNVCEKCHTTGIGTKTPSWTPAGFDHTQMSVATCETYHSGTVKISTGFVEGQPSNHLPPIPSSIDCGACHANTPAGETWTHLAGTIATLHADVAPSGCVSCHSGKTFAGVPAPYSPMSVTGVSPGKATPLSPPHIPVLGGADCSGCHSANYQSGGFGPATAMNSEKHAFVSTTCNTCHEAGKIFYMGSASPPLQGRPADHNSGQMAAPNDCGICHTTANWDSTVVPAGHMPNPAKSSCTVCHAKAPSDYSVTSLAANPILHTGITSGCITCHGAPNAAAPVFYPNYTPKDALLAPPHIPSGATPCEDCHSISFTTFSGTSMTAAKHTSMFAYVGSTCDACHDAVTPALSFYGVTRLTTRPSDHRNGKEKTSDCSGCHKVSSWDAGNALPAPPPVAKSKVALFASPPVAGGADATIPSAGGKVARVGLPHFGVISNCANCHNGVLAGGKGAGHVQSNALCENCHITSAWLPAHFDHRGVTAACSGCHNGAAMPGKPLTHLPTARNCDACHGTIAWRPATYDHSTSTARCSTCHNGIGAQGEPAGHVMSAQDCGSCHTTTMWLNQAPHAPAKHSVAAPRAAAGPTR